MSRFLTRPGVTRSFTTLEVLVAVGLVSVLAALLLGAASAARRNARAAMCSGSRRQVMIASLQYASENRMAHDAPVDPPALISRGYLRTINQCPEHGWYSIEKHGVMPTCTWHSRNER